jgi:hypothetical protein
MQDKTEVKTKLAGFDYSQGTAKGFARQRDAGSVTPPIRVIQSNAEMMEGIYTRLIDRMAKILRGHYKSHPSFVADSISSGFGPSFSRDINNLNVMNEKQLTKQMRDELADAQRFFFKNFVENNKDKVAMKIDFALNRDDVFAHRLDRLRELYLENSIKRISQEQDVLKRAFLSHYVGFITGQSVDFESFDDIVDRMKQTGVRESRFFARDQFSKFNKALTIASYEEADVSYVKWLTVRDFRVRGRPGGAYPNAKPSHWALHGKVFRIDQIPDEKNDYLCRCSLVPATEAEYIKQGELS